MVWRRFLTLFFFLLIPGTTLWAMGNPPDVKVSTNPIGTPFTRHLAHDYGFDLKKISRFEEKGFGRAEIITIAFISSHTSVEMKEYGKRRLEMNVSLRELAHEARLDYDELYKKANRIKKEIEAKGDKNLPPPVFPDPPDDKNNETDDSKAEEPPDEIEPDPAKKIKDEADKNESPDPFQKN